MPVIEARNLELTFKTNDGPVHALKDVNLSIEKGDFVSFIGPSGCGKTTFLRCMAALEHRSAIIDVGKLQLLTTTTVQENISVLGG